MSKNVFAERKCVRCCKPYQPTGATQKLCPDCKVIVKKENAAEYRIANKKTVKSVGEKKQPAAATSSHDSCIDDATILRVLIATGLISSETVQKARDIVTKLHG